MNDGPGNRWPLQIRGLIPRHRPPFGPLSLLLSGTKSLFRSPDISDLEREFADRLQVAGAVWLPSARYGIARAIQLVTPADADVYCPAFNCGAVHHAAHETQRTVHYQDCDPGSFLMSGDKIPAHAAASRSHAVILSEMFGHRFSADHLSRPLIASAALRVFDMAMAIPIAADMKRLVSNDLAVLSFGLGKSMYSGWGGMALTNNRELASDLRGCLHQDLRTFGRLARLKTFAMIVARTAAHEPRVYRHIRRQATTARSDCSASFSNESGEWRRPHTSLCRTLLQKNVAAMQDSIERRIDLASVYRRHLPESVIMPGLVSDDAALSHFSIRLPAERREAVRSALWSAGIDVGTLFPFPDHLLKRHDFPHAAACASEVINLPLSCQLQHSDVSHICGVLQRSLSILPAATLELPAAAA